MTRKALIVIALIGSALGIFANDALMKTALADWQFGDGGSFPYNVPSLFPPPGGSSQATGEIRLNGRIYVRDGKRWRPDDRSNLPLNWRIGLNRISNGALGYLNSANTCADQTVGELYVEANKTSNGVVNVVGTATMRYGRCAPSHARFIKAKRFQCIVPPGASTEYFEMRMTRNDQDDIVEVDFSVENTTPSQGPNSAPSYVGCNIVEHIN